MREETKAQVVILFIVLFLGLMSTGYAQYKTCEDLYFPHNVSSQTQENMCLFEQHFSCFRDNYNHKKCMGTLK